MEQKSIITPKTKVLELIETYPELENVLVEYAPAFKNLKNPILRRCKPGNSRFKPFGRRQNIRIESAIFNRPAN
ncbi:MAG: DUF1858 domain-containing protein [Draconibacterium sp.]|nr:DUF1858 domain-containing protein [Draconibacterium sp.]